MDKIHNLLYVNPVRLFSPGPQGLYMTTPEGPRGTERRLHILQERDTNYGKGGWIIEKKEHTVKWSRYIGSMLLFFFCGWLCIRFGSWLLSPNFSCVQATIVFSKRECIMHMYSVWGSYCHFLRLFWKYCFYMLDLFLKHCNWNSDLVLFEFGLYFVRAFQDGDVFYGS